MKVFFSWSGERSRKVAELLEQWIKCVLQATQPWISSRYIERGSVWFAEIAEQLKDTQIGVVCLTQDNKEKPWILFEAGALAKGLNSSRVMTLLVDLQPHEIKDPLAQFNHTMPDKEGIYSLIVTINNCLSEKGLQLQILQQVFETYWPQFDKAFSAILQTIPQTAVAEPRKADDLLGEILELSRGLSSRVAKLERQPGPDGEKIGYTYRKAPLGDRERLIRGQVIELLSAGIEPWEVQKMLFKGYGDETRGMIGPIIDDVLRMFDDNRVLKGMNEAGIKNAKTP